MTRNLDSVNTFFDYGNEFAVKHRDELGETAATWGGIVIGFMRAILECPDCPGHFRIPQDDNWDKLYCRNCKQWWFKKNDDE